MTSFFKGLFGKKKETKQTSSPSKSGLTGDIETSESLPINELPFDIQKPKEKEIEQTVTEPLEPEKIISVQYNPAYDLRDYVYPTLNLFSAENGKCLFRLKDINPEFSLPVLWSTRKEEVVIKDLSEIKSLFITGTQATGKTTFLHQLLISLLIKKHPSQIKLVLADTKGIEFSIYRQLEKHFLAKLPYAENPILSDYSKLVHTLNALCIEMDNRYELLREAGTRNIKEYNIKFIDRKLNPQKGHQYLPVIVLVIDDLGGFSLSSENELNLPLQKLVSEGYKAGIFTIISTSQFTGQAFSSALLSLISQRVVFNLNSKDDYRRFFDTLKLKTHLQQGEFYYNKDYEIGIGNTLLLEFSEIENVINHIGNQRGYPMAFLLPENIDETGLEGSDFDLSDRDSLFEDAARLIVQNQIASTSLIQRRMKLGYNRAGRLMNQLEVAGIVGPNLGSKARDVLILTEMELLKHLNTLG